MTDDRSTSAYVRALAAAPTLDALPPIVDPVTHAPLNPPERIQQKFVGSSYETSYAEAERFVDAAFSAWPGGDVAMQSVLDFGSGWGRITRMLLRRFRADQIWSSDIDTEMTTLLHSTLPGVNAVTNAPMPPTVFRDGLFDAVTAFSVFSHLSEDAHRLWAGEFARLTRVGGRAYITVLEDNFLGQVEGAQAAVAAGTASSFAANLALVHPDAAGALQQVRRGEFVYAGGGPDDDGVRSRSFYSWAVAPRPWVERTWGEAGFALVSWTPTGELFDQAMVVLERRDAPQAPARARRTPRSIAGGVKRRLRRR